MINTFLRKFIFTTLIILLSPQTHAELTIEISKDTGAAVPIAIVPFGWQGESNQPINLTSVIQADLTRSGVFKTLAERDMLTKPSKAENVKFRNWEVLGQEYLVIGQVNKINSQYKVQFQLFDVYKGERLLGYQLTVENNELRRTAHHISDMIYKELTGREGVFSSRIAYITTTKLKGRNNNLYKLLVADADGFEPKSIASSKEPIMSPTWSPDGKKIAYVSFESKRPEIFIQILADGKRTKVSSYRGINGAPAFSPDGKKLALTLSKDGSPDIYVLNLENRKLTRITKSYALDTEPTWSPNGETIVFTSNRGGRPQLYSISSIGGYATRLTFDGDYNAGAQFSSDGKSLAMVNANKGDYRVAVMDMATRTINILTAGKNDESPSFSANGDMVLYASKQGRQSVLSAASVDGRMQQDFTFDSGNVREPAWSK